MVQPSIASLETRLNAYEEFQKIRTTNSRRDVVKAISSRFPLSEQTIYEWYKGKTPIGKRAGTIIRVPELLYVLGALLGDGCICHWKGNFQVWCVGERAFTEKFAGKLSACIEKPTRAYKYGKKNAWFVKVGNAELFFLFKAVREDYSMVEKLVNDVGSPQGWLEFLEGFFDAEGCVKIIRGNGRRTPKACLDFTNTDLSLLEAIRTALKANLGVDSNFSKQAGVGNRKDSCHLRIYRKESIARFLDAIPTTKLNERKLPFVRAWLENGR